MNVYPPFRRGFDLAPYLHDHGPNALDWATFALVVLLVLMLAAAVLARAAAPRQRVWQRRGLAFAGPSGPPGSPSPPPAPNPREVLAMRYARGEITREEFLRATDDVSADDAPTVERPPHTD